MAKKSSGNPKASPKRAPRKYDRKKYRRNYLSEVIARVDFSPSLGLEEDSPSGHVKGLERRFPTRTKVLTENPHVTVTHEGQIASAAFTVHRHLAWRFLSSGEDRYYEISNNAIVIKYKKYDAYERLREDFVKIVDQVIGSLPDVEVSRVGLRYINTIELKESNPTEWTKYLNDSMLGAFNLATQRETVSRAFHTLEFNYGDGTQMRFQYGMPNIDYPAPVRKKQFILDWDAYAAGVALEVDEVACHLDTFHFKINAAFEEVIKDPLRNKMEPISG